MINEYVARQVALKDTQPCIICSKPSTTVLYNGSGPDWFYSCNIHLVDNPQFVVPMYTQEYYSSLEELKRLKQESNSLTQEDLSSWDGWVTKIFNKKPKEDSKEKEKEKEQEKVKEKESTESVVDRSSELKNEYRKALDRLSELQKKNKKYKLSQIMFESRTQLKQKQAAIAELKRKEAESYTNTEPDELLNKYSFPDIPNSTK
ncbi:hypothetical protein Kpol_541p47 [Vanderwaltozyma polyspora DSM 70294]|uniref:VPS4-associated protein 1 n=1 Tax=Vanderwaltozyma polyspora (strain ATCC 22028 / DSM 70294 / BCRC 21397 / CBS 2163 / NBRC 10782 / NRRL Y-8283 / UCD 57-17) TaxID=436907 RepID=A7TIZ3_VANPO|nr:uncharacterized protein Kpol_541p47 [Vanderwaltozyma polyspora DSM 70294]EDO17805.1 hypothetical protein Kpol_541p47 [Vanderwaltozyma polyspora DSM 70294]